MTMQQLVLADAFEMAKLAKLSIREIKTQINICSKELTQTSFFDDYENIKEEMLELEKCKQACEIALENINKFIKENKFSLN